MHTLLDALRASILARIQTTELRDPRPLGLSPEAKKAIELSVSEANRFRHHYIATEHLLLGRVALEDDVAAKMLRQHNAGDLASLRANIQRVLTEGGPHIRPPV
jgi:ATP-dependent Clp protease ATP-binding subunit ClpA